MGWRCPPPSVAPPSPRRAGSSPARRSSTLKGKLGLTRKDSMSGRNFNKKILHHSHHPKRNLVAIGARNSLYLFTAN